MTAYTVFVRLRPYFPAASVTPPYLCFTLASFPSTLPRAHSPSISSIVTASLNLNKLTLITVERKYVKPWLNYKHTAGHLRRSTRLWMLYWSCDQRMAETKRLLVAQAVHVNRSFRKVSQIFSHRLEKRKITLTSFASLTPHLFTIQQKLNFLHFVLNACTISRTNDYYTNCVFNKYLLPTHCKTPPPPPPRLPTIPQWMGGGGVHFY